MKPTRTTKQLSETMPRIGSGNYKRSENSALTDASTEFSNNSRIGSSTNLSTEQFKIRKTTTKLSASIVFP